MAITDAEAVKMINEYIRPLAEKLRNGKLEADEFLAWWDAGGSALVTNSDAELVEDGRYAHRIHGGDVNAFVMILQNFKADLDAPNVMDVVRKPCVRTLRTQ